MASPEQNRPLRVAIIGAGRMGRRHALAVAALRERDVAVVLAGVADRHLTRAEAVAAETHTVSSDDYRPLFRSADAVIVAIPAAGHFEIVAAALNSGLDVLVEKPVCPTLDQAAYLCRLAESRQRVLQVGHLEWFNPAWQAATASTTSPRSIDARRTGPFLPGGGDVDVVCDLMIHDLHLIQTWIGEEPLDVSATGRRVQSSTIDVAQARLTFPGGCVATLLASRVSPVRTRICRINHATSHVVVDFLEQSATVYSSSAVQSLPTARRDLLETQLLAFLSVVRSHFVGAVQGAALLQTMRTVRRITEVIAACSPLTAATATPLPSGFLQQPRR
jgi:predicted dehydrogenase